MPDPSSDCLFCKIAAGTIPAKIAFQNDELVAFYDINPGAPVHILIIPRQHIADTSALDDSTAPLMGRMVLAAAKLAREHNIQASGYRLRSNVGPYARPTVFHLPIHLLGAPNMPPPPPRPRFVLSQRI